MLPLNPTVHVCMFTLVNRVSDGPTGDRSVEKPPWICHLPFAVTLYRPPTATFTTARESTTTGSNEKARAVGTPPRPGIAHDGERLAALEGVVGAGAGVRQEVHFDLCATAHVRGAELDLQRDSDGQLGRRVEERRGGRGRADD